jgi:hypothetical protein
MEKRQFTDIIDRLSKEATLKEWKEVAYEKQLDTLVWKKTKLSKNTVLVKVSHDTYLYLTPKKRAEGIMVEYLKGNFTKHNTEYKNIFKFFDKEISSGNYTLSKKDKNAEDYFDKFTETVRADIYKDAIQDKKTVNDLEFTIKLATT